MVLSIEACERAVETINTEIKRFNTTMKQQQRKSLAKIGLSQEELDNIDKVIHQELERLRETRRILEAEGEQKSWFLGSKVKMGVLVLSTIAVTITGLACAAFGSTHVVQYGGFIGASGSAIGGGATTYYTAYIAMNSEQKNKLDEISEKGVKNAELFEKVLEIFKHLKEDEANELKNQELKGLLKTAKRERRKSQSIKSLSNYVTSSPPPDKMVTRSFTEPIPRLALEMKEEMNGRVEAISKKEVPDSPAVHWDKNTEEIKGGVETLAPIEAKNKDVKALVEKITECLRRYENLPIECQDDDSYLSMLSNFTLFLPEEHPLKQELKELANNKTRTKRVIQKGKEVPFAQKYSTATEKLRETFKVSRSIDYLNLYGKHVTLRGTVKIKGGQPVEKTQEENSPEVIQICIHTPEKSQQVQDV